MACDGGTTDPDDGGNPPTPTIALSLSASTISVPQGASATVTATITRGGYTGAVNIAIDGAPAGLGTSAAPATVAVGSTTTCAGGVVTTRRRLRPPAARDSRLDAIAQRRAPRVVISSTPQVAFVP
jgi:hypothetical protein